MWHLSFLLLCAFVAFQGIVAKPVQKIPPDTKDIFGRRTSHASPQPLPDSVDMYQHYAVLAQQSNCMKYHIGQEVSDAKLLYAIGDSDYNQRMEIFHSKSLGIVVSWAGMNQTGINSVLQAADLFLEDVDRDLFPNARQGAKAFSGFQNEYKRVADIVLDKVNEFQNKYDEDRVSLTGLSFGSGIAAVGSLHVNCNLKRGKLHRVVVFGLPRSGNQEWADSIDDALKDRFYYVVNGLDLVPRAPPRELGYQHPSGQIWINPSNSTHASFYPGQENVHGANSEWGFSIPDHTGWYFNTHIASYWENCPARIGHH